MTPSKPESVFANIVSSKTGADYYESATIIFGNDASAIFGNDASAVLSRATGLPKHCRLN